MEARVGRHQLGLQLASHGEGRDGLKDGEGWAPLAHRREVADADLVAREREAPIAPLLHREHLHLAEEHLAVEHPHADPGGRPGGGGGATAATGPAPRDPQRRGARRGHREWGIGGARRERGECNFTPAQSGAPACPPPASAEKRSRGFLVSEIGRAHV